MSTHTTSTPATRQLHGRTALVTGASRGIGRGIARKLAADGARVAVNYQHNADLAAGTVEAITAGGGDAVAIQADIGVPADVERLFKETLTAFGGLDILVNNAGINAEQLPAVDIDLDTLDRYLNVNLRGTFLTAQQAARHLRDGGRIINISTGYTRYAAPNVGVYAGTKAAVERMTVSLAHEVGPRGITVNAVLPGPVETDGMTGDPQLLEDWIATTPLRRLGQVEDVADVVAFLAGDAARWITGQSIGATGGLA